LRNLVRAESASTQPYRVYSGIGYGLSCCFDKWRHVFSNQRSSRYKRMRPNFTKLMNSDHPRKHDIVPHCDVASQRTGVGEDTVVTDKTIMGDMTIRLNKAIFSNRGLVSIFRASIDRYTFAYCRIITDLGSRNLSFKLYILRFTRNNGSG